MADKAMPAKLITADNATPGEITVSLLPGGQVEVRWPGWGAQEYKLNTKIRDEIWQQIQNLLPPMDYYWRATNNADEIVLIKSGELWPSTNHADGSTELGLSVTDHFGYVMSMGYKYGYRVRGTVIGAGSDGEPILKLSSLQPLDPRPRPIAGIRANEEAARRKALKQALADIGWTIEDYHASFWAFVVPAEKYEEEYKQYKAGDGGELE